MKKLLNLSIFISFIFCMSCSEDLLHDQNLPDDVNIDLSLSKKAPVYEGIDFEFEGFASFVFYDNINGPDGLFLLNKNKLLVVKERPDNAGVYLAKRGRQFSLSDAFSTMDLPFESPDDMTVDESGNVYVADGQAQTVFKIDKQGGIPTPFVTASTTGSGVFNPFGVAIAPSGFDGENVDPGDLIVCDNAIGDPSLCAVWAVNRSTGIAKIIAQGAVFDGGPIRASFNSEGTLFVTLNLGPGNDNEMVIVGSDGSVSPFQLGLSAPFFAIHPLTDDIYFKKKYSDDIYDIHVIPKTGGISTLFASNVSTTPAGTQDMVFNKQGTSLYVSSRNASCVLEIYNKKGNW